MAALEHRDYMFLLKPRTVLSCDEVALVKALWALGPCEAPNASHCDAGGCGYDPVDDPVLHAFCEKVEQAARG